MDILSALHPDKSAYVAEVREYQPPTKSYEAKRGTELFQVGPFNRVAVLCPKDNIDDVWEAVEAFVSIGDKHNTEDDKYNGVQPNYRLW